MLSLLTRLKKRKKKARRPRMDDKEVLSAILYILRASCQWNALPRRFGASSTVHGRFQ
jgi:transposase